ncbi:MAG: hypothetical protein IKE17_03190 [Clostridia bacterium]|nr:hypothetical protein [Clostridia bacterium]
MDTVVKAYEITEDDLIPFNQFKKSFNLWAIQNNIIREMALLTVEECYIVARTAARMVHIGMNEEDRKLLKHRRRNKGE